MRDPKDSTKTETETEKEPTERGAAPGGDGGGEGDVATGALGEEGIEASFFADKTMAELRDEVRATERSASEPMRAEGEEELERLLKPRRSRRHPILALIVVIASGFALYWLWEDFRFWTRSSKPVDLGRAMDAVKSGKLEHNTYVKLRGIPVPQSTAVAKLKSKYASSSKRQWQWFLLAGTDHRIVVKHEVTGRRHRRTRFKTSFTGRLRRLDSVDSSQTVRRFYLRQSLLSPTLRPYHRFAGSEVLRHAGKPRAELTNLEGKKVELRRDTILSLFVAFPGQYEYALDGEKMLQLKGVEVVGGAGAKRCDKRSLAGRGGDVYLKPDPNALELRRLETTPRYAAGAARDAETPSELPRDGEDVVIPIPPGTKVFSAKARECATACRGRLSAACHRGCFDREHLEIPLIDGRHRVALGGGCGFPGEKHRIELHLTPFETPAHAERYVASLGHPYIRTEVDEALKLTKFILKLPRALADGLIRRQTKETAYTISAREEVYRVKWRYLQRRGHDLLITRASRGFPDRYEVKRIKGRPRLVEIPPGPSLRLRGEQIRRADVSMPLRLPPDAFLLEDGVRPSSMWMEPFTPGVPIIYLVLVGFILFNLWAIRTAFRK